MSELTRLSQDIMCEFRRLSWDLMSEFRCLSQDIMNSDMMSCPDSDVWVQTWSFWLGRLSSDVSAQTSESGIHVWDQTSDIDVWFYFFPFVFVPILTWYTSLNLCRLDNILVRAWVKRAWVRQCNAFFWQWRCIRSAKTLGPNLYTLQNTSTPPQLS